MSRSRKKFPQNLVQATIHQIYQLFNTKLERPTIVACHVNVISAFNGLYYNTTCPKTVVVKSIRHCTV